MVPYPTGLDFLCIGSDGEIVHRVFLSVFHRSTDAYGGRSLCTLVCQSVSNVFGVVV